MVVCNPYFLLVVACLLQILFSHAQREKIQKLDNAKEIATALKPLTNMCVDNVLAQQWWSYSVCFGHQVKQVHYDVKSNQAKQAFSLGTYMPHESTPNHQIYRDPNPTCAASPSEMRSRYTEVTLECCGGDVALQKTARQSLFKEEDGSSDRRSQKPLNNLYIAKIVEPVPCSYYIYVCSELMCKMPQKEVKKVPVVASSKAVVPVPPPKLPKLPSSEEQTRLKEKAREMFNFAYTAYMDNAFPAAELMPVSCEGGKFDLIKIPMVTLVDTLDTLVILGNHSEFRRAVDLVVKRTPNYNVDVNVSVFETTIRMVGGLLSAHLMAIDPALGVYSEPRNDSYQYNDELLALCIDLGERLLPAFETKTGIPYGTVNLKFGVPTGETKIASVAGAGSLLVEFQVLSYLSGDPKFGDAAYIATEALYARRSSLDLMGKHISTETGQWHEALSGIGSNADSFYEYLLKSYLLFRNEELYQMFTDTYRAIKRFVLVNDHWFTEVDMFSGKLHRKRVENLDAFWPGVEAMLGNSHFSAKQLNTFYAVWNDLGFLPEEFDYGQYQLGKGVTNAYYPLRPELIESTYHQYRTTGDRSWLIAGREFLDSIETHTKTLCGYASVSNLNSMELEDSMPSFFLSETLKYLYLLFDEDNFIHHRPYIFSTEAHPFDSAQLFLNDRRHQNLSQAAAVELVLANTTDLIVDVSGEVATSASADPTIVSQFRKITEMLKEKLRMGGDAVKDILPLFGDDISADISGVEVYEEAQGEEEEQQELAEEEAAAQAEVERTLQEAAKSFQQSPAASTMLPFKCRKRLWWDRSSGYDSNFLTESNRLAREEASEGAEPAPEPTKERLVVDSINMVLDQLEEIDQAVDGKDGSGSGSKKRRHSARSKMAAKAARRPNTCYPEEAPQPAADANMLKNVDINMGDLGMFNVKVFSDSFSVTNKDEKNGIDITNIGTSLVLVKDYDSKRVHSRTVTAFLSGQVASCRVTAGDGRSELFSRPCSLANFGRLESVHLRADMAVPNVSGGFLCKTQAEYQAASKKRWWQWSLPSTLPAEEQEEDYEDKFVLVNRGECLFEEKAVAARKEKAKAVIIRNNEDHVFIMAGRKEVDKAAAVAEGAAPVAVDAQGRIVRPAEKKKRKKSKRAAKKSSPPAGGVPLVQRIDSSVTHEDLEGPAEEQPLSVPVVPVESAEAADSTVPTVMLAKNDADRLAVLMEKWVDADVLSGEGGVRVGIDISVQNMLLNSEFMGDYSYPKVWMKANMVYIIGSGKWGTFITSKSGEDWQLYLMARKDMSHASVVPATTVTDEASGMPVSVGANILTNPVEQYAFTIARKCPNVIKVRGDGSILLKSS